MMIWCDDNSFNLYGKRAIIDFYLSPHTVNIQYILLSCLFNKVLQFDKVCDFLRGPPPEAGVCVRTSGFVDHVTRAPVDPEPGAGRVAVTRHQAALHVGRL